MIVSKKKGQEPQLPAEEVEVESVRQMPIDGIIDVFKAVKEILRGVRWEYGDPHSPLIFRSVLRDDGQFNRIVVNGANMEEGIGFPAVFIHFINIHWLKPTSSVREGRAELRVRFVMNRLNLHDRDDTETEIDWVAMRIKQEFEEKRYNYDCLSERLSLDYYDPVETFDHGLQACWMTWDIWFRETSVWVKRKWVRRNIVLPPFANHADQDTSIKGVNPMGHGNLDHPRKYDEATGLVYSGVKSEENDKDSDDNDDGDGGGG